MGSAVFMLTVDPATMPRKHRRVLVAGGDSEKVLSESK